MSWHVFLFALTDGLGNSEHLDVPRPDTHCWIRAPVSGGWGAPPLDLTPQQASFVRSMGNAMCGGGGWLNEEVAGRGLLFAATHCVAAQQ